MITGRSGVHRRAHGVQKAARFLEELLAAGRVDSLGRIPPIRRLAAQAGVSPVTMLKATHLLRRDGHLAATGRRRLRVPSPPVEQTTASVASCVWERTAEAIAGDLLNGMYPPERALPSCKELGRQYGVHHRTLRTALASLVARGMLVPRGRSYFAPSLSGPQRSLAVVSVLPCDTSGRPLTIFGEEFVRHLEMRCAASRLRLVLRAYWWDGAEPVTFRDPATGLSAPVLDDTEIAGYLFVASATECGRGSIIRELSRHGRPVAVLDEEGDWLPSPSPQWGAGVRLFSMGVSHEPAREMGRYLMSLGHRSIAYLSPFHGAVWSRRRVEGLREIVSAAGGTASLRVVAIDGCQGHGDYQQAGEEHGAIDRLRAFQRQWRAAAPPEFAAPSAQALEAAIADIARQGEIYRRMAPAMDEALRDRRITAWVMADDYAAAIAWRYLEDRRVKVPGDLSVVSFDDSAQAVALRLTSYNFNLPAIVNAMLGHVMGRDVDAGRRSALPTYVKGMIVERQTTRVLL